MKALSLIVLLGIAVPALVSAIVVKLWEIIAAALGAAAGSV